MRILGIETSCDETAAAIVENGQRLLSNAVASSIALHKHYGGVVPEIAARSHIESIVPVVEQVLNEANCDWAKIDAIAVTQGPGLGGCLLIGVMTARTLAIIKNKPLYAVNHVEAHVYANFITTVGSNMQQALSSKQGASSHSAYRLPLTAPEFPILALIVSGGHTQLVLFEDHFKYQVLGRTQDDAVGEAYDKVAKILGLPYPGGPSIEKAAQKGNKTKYQLPKAKMPDKYDFSYSGLKTAVLRLAQIAAGEDYSFPSYKLSEKLSVAQKTDIAACFSHIAVEVLVDKTVQAYDEFTPKSVVIAGGVAASPELRRQMSERLPINIEYTDIKLCTDNAAMIAANAYYQVKTHHKPTDPKVLGINPALQM